jgi:dTDP-4-dehydrorhamnose 3,5-epimerase
MGKTVTKAQPTLYPLKIIPNPKGDILHALKASDRGFQGFGEAYFSCILPGETKGWKKHLHMTINLVVPAGKVRFSIHDETSRTTYNFLLGGDNYGRLMVPPGYWVAFTGIADMVNMILNIADIPHDPNESETLPIESLPLGQQQ